MAPGFLLRGQFEDACACAEEALAGRPNSVNLQINCAHALMGLDRAEEAGAIYLRYRGKKMSGGKSCDAFILAGLAKLRAAGHALPWMHELERSFGPVAVATETPAKSDAPARETDQPIPVQRPRLTEIELGEKLVDQSKLEEALAEFRRGLAICEAKLANDGTDREAQCDLDLLVGKIGSIAFDFLRMRRAKVALDAIVEAISYRPEWVWLRLIHAHALMYCADVSGMLNVHREYRGRTLETGASWADAIRYEFAALCAADAKHPMMAEIKRQFAPRGV